MIRRSALAPVAALALLATVYGGAAVAANPTLSVNPTKLVGGQKATVQATHLKKGQLYTVLLAVPNLKKPAAERFLGSGKADKNGTLQLKLKVPVIPNCGKATLSVFRLPVTSATPASSISVKLSGCKGVPLAAPKGPAPPPPPNKP